MDLLNYVVDTEIILIPALYVLGVIFKKTERISDKYIPCILLVLGIAASLGVNGFNMQSVVQGVLVTGAATLSNQLIKQATKEE